MLKLADLWETNIIVGLLGKFKIVDFLNLKNLELSSYPHNYITNIIVKYFKKYN